MKKIVLILAILMLGVFVCACGNDANNTSSKNELSVEEKVAKEVESRLKIKIINEYDIHGLPSFSSRVTKIEENKFAVTGNVSVYDTNDDKYTGNYEAIVEYNPETDDYSIADYNLGELYKNNG